MNRRPSLVIAAFIALISHGTAQADAVDRGQQLFGHYGCANCHGADGMNTVSKFVPILKGKPAAFIVQRAEAILNGEVSSAPTRMMHGQFCASGDTQPCQEPPSREELTLMATWLDNGKAIPAMKTTPQKLYLTSRETYERVTQNKAKTLFIDVRTPAEVAFVGYPNSIDFSIPYVYVRDWRAIDERRKSLKVEPSTSFLVDIDQALKAKGLEKSDTIIVICRSGDRSAKAAAFLYLSGYTNVYSVIDGFEGDVAKEGLWKGERALNGWKNNDLPWTYELDKDKIKWLCSQIMLLSRCSESHSEPLSGF